MVWRVFLSTYPVRGTTRVNGTLGQELLIFLSTYPVRGTTCNGSTSSSARRLFLSTYPVRGTTSCSGPYFQRRLYFYPRTPCGVRLSLLVPLILLTNISIHVPRAGYDAKDVLDEGETAIFLSTYPVRGTTVKLADEIAAWQHFYPRTPCGVRPGDKDKGSNAHIISIHVPRAGYDKIIPPSFRGVNKFLSTYPVRGTTHQSGNHRQQNIFLSTYPVRGTTILFVMLMYGFIFLSTYPVRGTTNRCRLYRKHRRISIHVPRAGYDSKV